MGDASKFSLLTLKKHGYATYRDNNKEKILGIGKVGKTPSTSIENVLLVDGLKHNLLSISQLCDKRNRVTFDSNCCIIEGINDKQVKFIEHKVDNIYMISLDDISSYDVQCLMS